MDRQYMYIQLSWMYMNICAYTIFFMSICICTNSRHCEEMYVQSYTCTYLHLWKPRSVKLMVNISVISGPWRRLLCNCSHLIPGPPTSTIHEVMAFEKEGHSLSYWLILREKIFCLGQYECRIPGQSARMMVAVPCSCYLSFLRPQDPRVLGTLLRTATAFEWQAVWRVLVPFHDPKELLRWVLPKHRGITNTHQPNIAGGYSHSRNTVRGIQQPNFKDFLCKWYTMVYPRPLLWLVSLCSVSQDGSAMKLSRSLPLMTRKQRCNCRVFQRFSWFIDLNQFWMYILYI